MDDLDVVIGLPLSVDLLVTLESRRLIEVKSASRNAVESLILDLRKHLDIWGALCPQPTNQPVEGEP